MRNEISNAVLAGDNSEKLDANCKRVLANKQIAAAILQECAEEYKGLSLEQIIPYIEGNPQISEVPTEPDLTGKYLAEQRVNGISNELASLYEGTVKFDVIFKAFFPNHEEQAELIVNIEAQNNFNPGYSLVTRGVYYCARMLSAQKEQGFVGSNYGGLKKVYSVWICMHPTKEWESTITTYKITEESTAGFPKEDKSAYDKLQVAKVCLGERDADNPKKLLRILETLFSSDLPASEKLEMLEQEGIDCESLESEVSEMCNYSKGVREEGIQQGIQQGMQQGMQQGKQRGKLEAILALRETMLNVDLNKIMDMLKIPQGDRAFYLDEIKKLEEKQDK